MASLGDRTLRQPYLDGQRWTTEDLPLTDIAQGTYYRTFTADAEIYNPTPIKTFTADACIRGKVFEDTFTRTLTNEYGDSDLGHATLVNPSNGFDINGTLSVVTDNDIEIYFGPSNDVGEIFVDFLAVEDFYLFLAGPPYRRPSTGRNYFPSIDIFEDTGTWSGFTPDNFEYFPTIVDDEWHTLRFVYNNYERTYKVKIWLRSDPEPASWTAEGYIADRGNISSTQADMYLGWWQFDSLATAKTIDNLQLWTIDSARTSNFFTADAFLLRQVSATFTADAVIQASSGTFEFTFTADAVLEIPHVDVTFTANAVLKKTIAGTFTANARIVNSISQTFTANAVISAPLIHTFTANAYIFRPQAVTISDAPKLRKSVTMNILQHREKPLPTYIPPRIPDQEDLPDDGDDGRPPCLPPCPGAGAGFGADYGATGNAIVTTIQYCSHCDNYTNTGDNWIGKGPVGTGTHCGCEATHTTTTHVNRMFIAYNSAPDGKYRMRARMVWDLAAPSTVTVLVYTAASPILILGDCTGSLSNWDSGMLLGRMTFVADGSGAIGERNVWFQEAPSELVLDAGAYGGSTFKFQLEDEGTNYRAEFKAANVQIVTD